MHVCLRNLFMHCPPWTEEDIIWAVRLFGVTDGHDVGAGNQTVTISKISQCSQSSSISPVTYLKIVITEHMTITTSSTTNSTLLSPAKTKQMQTSCLSYNVVFFYFVFFF